MPQNQEEIEAKLAAYIDGELDAAGRAEIEKHLEINPQHRTLIRDLMAQRDLVRSLPRATAPAEIAETLQGQLERSVLLGGGLDAGADTGMRISPWPHRGAIAAIILLTAGLSFFVYKVLPSNKPPELAVVPSRDAPMPATLSTEQPVAELPLASADRSATDRLAEAKVKSIPQADLAVAPTIAPSAATTIAPPVQASVAPTEATPTTPAIASSVANTPGDVAAKPQAVNGATLALTPSAVSGGGGGGLNLNNNGAPLAEKSATENQAGSPSRNGGQEWCVLVTSDDPVSTDAQVRAFLIANQIRFEPLPASAQKDFEAGYVAESRLRGPVAQLLTRGLSDDRRAAAPATQPASLGLLLAAPTTQQAYGVVADKLPTTVPSIASGSLALADPSTPTTAPTIAANHVPTTLPAASDAEAVAAPATQPTKESQASAEPTTQPSTQPPTGELAVADQTMLYCSDITVTQANDLKSMLALRAGQSAQLIEPPQWQNAPTTSPALTLSAPVVSATQPVGQTIEQSANQNQNGLADQQTGGVPPQAQSILAQSVPATAAVDEKSEQKVNLVVIVRRGQLLANPGPTTVPAIVQPPVAAPATPEKAAEPPADAQPLKNP